MGWSIRYTCCNISLIRSTEPLRWPDSKLGTRGLIEIEKAWASTQPSRAVRCAVNRAFDTQVWRSPGGNSISFDAARWQIGNLAGNGSSTSSPDRADVVRVQWGMLRELSVRGRGAESSIFRQYEKSRRHIQGHEKLVHSLKIRPEGHPSMFFGGRI